MTSLNRLLSITALAILVFAAFGCSNTRDGRAYRIYHNLHAHYNGFFYANEAMEEADESMYAEYEENWDAILPIFIPVDDQNAQSVYPLMERAIEKCTRVVDKHTMQPSSRDRKDLKWPELNKWIDDNYDIIGRAHLIKGDSEKAEEVFQYLIRTLDYDDAQAWANAWLGRTYMAMGDQVRANTALMKAVSFDEVKDENRLAFAHLVYASYYLKYDQIEAACEQLEQAIAHTPKKRDRARTIFILAQCLEASGRSTEAIERYKEVVDLRTPYELEFYAKIKQAMAFDRRGGSSEPIVELLFDMLDDKKNEQYQDQIYYALAELALEEREREDGYDYLFQSLEVNDENQRQRMKSYLRLGDLFMEDLNYVSAQAYYDSAVTYMDDEEGRFEEVSGLAENLTSLVGHLQTIQEQDSLLAICDLDEDERMDRVAEIVADMEAAAEAARLAAEAAAEAELAAAGDGGVGMFWPYNGQLKLQGRRNFQDYWGDRVLEDNWRRSQKTGIAFSNEEELGAVDVQQESTGPTGIPSVEDLLAGLPCEPDQRDSSMALIAESYYLAGVDYKEKLNDPENAIESWEALVNRFEKSDYHPTAYYQLFRTYLQREVEENYQNPFCGTCNSEYWANMVTTNYPGSEWAIMIENPEYADEEEMRREADRAVYEAFLMRYYQKDYQQVLLDITPIIEESAPNYFMCQYRLLRAQCIGGLSALTGGDRRSYFESLYAVVDSCPETEEGEFALALLTQLDGLRAPEANQDKEPEETEDSPFAYKPYLEHYFGMIVPVGRGDVEALKAKIADFNGEYFQSQNLRVTANLIDRNHQIILVKSFKKQVNAMDYYSVFVGNREDLIEMNSSGYDQFIITSENYVELFKSKNITGYMEFFEETYLSDEK